MTHVIPEGWYASPETECERYFCTTCGHSYDCDDDRVEHVGDQPVAVVHYSTGSSEVWERHALTPIRRHEAD